MTRIIVADDDRVSSHLLSTILRKNGYAPDAALDVPSLFAACAREPVPAAILLDLNMPGGTGADSIRHIRGDERLAGVPVIIVSGSNDPAEREESLRLGAVAFVGKPIDWDALLDTLRRHIAAR